MMLMTPIAGAPRTTVLLRDVCVGKMANTNVDMGWEIFIWEMFIWETFVWERWQTRMLVWETSVRRSVTPTVVVMEYIPHSTPSQPAAVDEDSDPRNSRIHRCNRCMVHTHRGWRRNLVGYAHHWTGLYLPILLPASTPQWPQLLGGTPSEIILSAADISNTPRFVITRYARYTTAAKLCSQCRDANLVFSK